MIVGGHHDGRFTGRAASCVLYRRVSARAPSPSNRLTADGVLGETGSWPAPVDRVGCPTVNQWAIRAAHLVHLDHSRTVVGGRPVATRARDVAALECDTFSRLLGDGAWPLPPYTLRA